MANLKLRYAIGDKVSVEGRGRSWNGYVTKQARTPINHKYQVTPIDGGVVPQWIDEEDLRCVEDKYNEIYPTREKILN